MGFFDGGFFGNMFDLNGDGKLDFSEQMMDAAAFMHLMQETEKEEAEDSSFGFSSSDTTDDEQEDELELLTGYTREDLEYMDEEYRNEVFEDCGLDADDYGF